MKKSEKPNADDSKSAQKTPGVFDYILNFKYLVASILVLSFAYFILVLNPSTSKLTAQIFSTQTNTNDLSQKPDKNTDKMAESNAASDNSDNWKNAQSIYEFTAPDIEGKMVEMSKYK